MFRETQKPWASWGTGRTGRTPRGSTPRGRRRPGRAGRSRIRTGKREYLRGAAEEPECRDGHLRGAAEEPECRDGHLRGAAEEPECPLSHSQCRDGLRPDMCPLCRPDSGVRSPDRLQAKGSSCIVASTCFTDYSNRALRLGPGSLDCEALSRAEPVEILQTREDVDGGLFTAYFRVKMTLSRNLFFVGMSFFLGRGTQTKCTLLYSTTAFSLFSTNIMRHMACPNYELSNSPSLRS